MSGVHGERRQKRDGNDGGPNPCVVQSGGCCALFGRVQGNAGWHEQKQHGVEVDIRC